MSELLEACTACGCDVYEYSVRCWDHRTGGFGEESESSEIAVMGCWPKTVKCSNCKRRYPIEQVEPGS